MKSYGQSARQFDQSPGALNVHPGISLQYAEHDAIHTELPGRQNVVAHDLKFIVGITKVAGSRANQNVNGNADVAANGLHEPRTRSGPSGRQVAAQLNAL